MTDKILYLEIITPKEVIFKGDVQAVTVPGSKSPFQILFNHAPIVSSLDEGQIKIADANNKELVYTNGTGFVELQNNRISILVEDAVIVE
ncbi:MAG: ATP synthase F1 subunit epsilon [Ignavibacteriae bacterium HGW-Ignavibacteriae-4]|jgi:F-type H+-transporting ATPase subunit epsilon|nr:MAG: ATP synthase F1 subunit epsilon [Ignavibacteriae bacterium HGW-Ignavibacteriae-4]